MGSPNLDPAKAAAMWKAHVEKENAVLYHKWPANWGFTVSAYENMNKALRAHDITLMESNSSTNHNGWVSTETDEVRPSAVVGKHPRAGRGPEPETLTASDKFPPTASGMIGWRPIRLSSQSPDRRRDNVEDRHVRQLQKSSSAEEGDGKKNEKYEENGDVFEAERVYAQRARPIGDIHKTLKWPFGSGGL